LADEGDDLEAMLEAEQITEGGIEEVSNLRSSKTYQKILCAVDARLAEAASGNRKVVTDDDDAEVYNLIVDSNRILVQIVEELDKMSKYVGEENWWFICTHV
jgi:hypothetical protein